jgi:hypothetical protein
MPSTDVDGSPVLILSRKEADHIFVIMSHVMLNQSETKTVPPGSNRQSRIRPSFHPCFQVLVDLVDREHPFDHFDVATSQKILRFYAWWTVERPHRLALCGCVTIANLEADGRGAGSG